MIFPQSTLSDHAKIRLAERSQLDEMTLVAMLNQQMGRKISVTKCRSHLAHRLYWSSADQDFYVAIQDVVTGTVLTLLTLSMYEAFYPGVACVKAQRKVMNQAILAGYAPPERWVRSKVGCYVTVNISGAARSQALGRWEKALDEPNVAVIGRMRVFWEWVLAQLDKRGIALDSLDGVALRLPFADAELVSYGC